MDEKPMAINGSLSICSPQCTSSGLLKRWSCPNDQPPDSRAAAGCNLVDDDTNLKYCALICSPTAVIRDQKAAADQCGTNASCKSIQTVGLCTYDD